MSEFQSDAVELEEREPSRIAYLSLYLVTALIVAGITWACLSQVDKIVVARGKLATTQPNLVVQALETSVIRSVHAAAGDVVKKGQVLARLDPTFTQSDVRSIADEDRFPRRKSKKIRGRAWGSRIRIALMPIRARRTTGSSAL